MAANLVGSENSTEAVADEPYFGFVVCLHDKSSLSEPQCETLLNEVSTRDVLFAGGTGTDEAPREKEAADDNANRALSSSPHSDSLIFELDLLLLSGLDCITRCLRRTRSGTKS